MRFIIPEPLKPAWATKPWPSDAVMIIASNAGEELRDQMEQAVPQTCRDCCRPLMADTHTIRKAENLPERHGRPIKFFCIQCAVGYEFPVNIHDDRGRKK